MEFSAFFKEATGRDPFPYQERIATDSIVAEILCAPTGAGKTAAIILGWVWRRLFASDEIRSTTQSRLVYCLPMRVLVDQTFKETYKWLHKLDLGERVGLHVLMGGEDAGNWHLRPEQEAIIIGTQDMLLSRALNRGYGMSRYRWPMDFGLLNNDSLWVLDEVQLMGSGLATTTQLDAFRQVFGTAAPCKSVWMSATLKEEWLQTVDFKAKGRPLQRVEISDADRKNRALKSRLAAHKTLKCCDKSVSDWKGIVASISHAHHPGSLTLVVVNTVERAVKLYQALEQEVSEPQKAKKKKEGEQSRAPKGSTPDLLLIHSRFRPLERAEKIERLLSSKTIPEAGRIAVTTQVIEAGVDVSAKTLFTELAPWASVVQRFGRCNRYGEYDEAEVFWIDVLKVEETIKGKRRKQGTIDEERISNALPYSLEELEAAREQLNNLHAVSPVSLERHLKTLDQSMQTRLFYYVPTHVIRRKDLVELFDTTPDLAGSDIDVSRFIRDGEDLDVQVFWRDVPGEGPAKEDMVPRRQELCPVPVNRFREFIKSKQAFRWDSLYERPARVNSREVFPGQTYLIPAQEGGYDPALGWNVASEKKVQPVELHEDSPLPEANDSDQDSQRRTWQKISEHTDRVVVQLEDIVRKLNLDLVGEIKEALMVAARWHDRGKAHEVFRDAIVFDDEHKGDDWAKAPKIDHYKRKGFRHELAGALAMLATGMSDLACYLAAAHHGKVRLSIRSLPTEKPPGDRARRFARGVYDGDNLPPTDLGGGVVAGEAILSLEPMELGLSVDGKPSWAERMLNLRDDPKIGPFRLAFLETLLRAADMRASADGTPESHGQESKDA